MHENLWTLNFESLLSFHAVHSHYNVPYHYYNPITTGKEERFLHEIIYHFIVAVILITMRVLSRCRLNYFVLILIVIVIVIAIVIVIYCSSHTHTHTYTHTHTHTHKYTQT